MKLTLQKFRLVILLNCFTLVSIAQLPSDLKLAVEGYFEERITMSDEETHLIPFMIEKKLSLKSISMANDKIWKVWKETYLAQDTLPYWTEAESIVEEIPTYSWSLKRESPMPFYWISKGKPAHGEKYSFFLNLHGSGPKDMEFKNTLAWTLRYQDAPSLYFIPQIPSEQRYRWWFQPVQYSWERLFRLVMLNEAIDPNKLFIMGISEGGYGSQRLGAFYADYLAGVGPMAGGEPLKNAPPLNFRNIAFSLETGEHDHGFGRNKLTLEAKQAFGKLEQEYPGSFTHKVQLQEGKGHGIDYTQTSPWLVQHSRVTHPNRMSWVLFPMDGRYRKGFYNIALTQPLHIQEGDEFDRMLFDVKYEGNDIFIKVQLLDNDMIDTRDIEHLEFALYLDDKYVDLTKKVKVHVNGKRVYNSKPQLKWNYLIESCALFGDPERLYPAKIDISI